MHLFYMIGGVEGSTYVLSVVSLFYLSNLRNKCNELCGEEGGEMIQLQRSPKLIAIGGRTETTETGKPINCEFF